MSSFYSYSFKVRPTYHNNLSYRLGNLLTKLNKHKTAMLYTADRILLLKILIAKPFFVPVMARFVCVHFHNKVHFRLLQGSGIACKIWTSCQHPYIGGEPRFPLYGNTRLWYMPFDVCSARQVAAVYRRPRTCNNFAFHSQAGSSMRPLIASNKNFNKKTLKSLVIKVWWRSMSFRFDWH